MGTSVNQSSPRTINWAAAQAGYRDNVPIDRVVQEIWRAATNQPEGNLARLLADPIIARLGQIANEGSSAVQVAMATSLEVAHSKKASLAAAIAQRAATQCLASENRTKAYGERVFAEACNYLLSRDLPGYIGGNNRNATVGDALEFKHSVLSATISAAQDAGRPDVRSAASWRTYVQTVVSRLQGRIK
jgi:hypothetical protein